MMGADLCPTGPAPRCRYVDLPGRRPDTPVGCRRPMAEHRLGAVGEHRGHPMALGSEGPVTHRVYTTVYTLQAAHSPAVADVVVGQAEGDQLPGRNHAVLAIRQFRDHTIG